MKAPRTQTSGADHEPGVTCATCCGRGKILVPIHEDHGGGNLGTCPVCGGTGVLPDDGRWLKTPEPVEDENQTSA
jgi:hypothetical protein